ncbi:unnamed protein product, partial [Didymodactylos carnosus]
MTLSSSAAKRSNGCRLTSLPSDFDLKSEMSNVLLDSFVQKQLADIFLLDSNDSVNNSTLVSDDKITTTSTNDINDVILKHMSHILHVLEPIILNKIEHRLSKMELVINELDVRLNDIERYNRSFNLRFLNVPVERDEDPIQTVANIGYELGLSIDYCDIENAHRIPIRLLAPDNIGSSLAKTAHPVLIAR